MNRLFRPPERLHPYAQLVRLPNVFTALADIALGALAVHALPAQAAAFMLLSLASACLYAAGMVLNDVFDIEQDRRERPFRPLPSGRIARRSAAQLGTVLLAAGVLLAALAGLARGGSLLSSSFLFAFALAACVLAYDAWLKLTWAGPIVMGACRFLNVLLGLSIAGPIDIAWGLHLAAVVGLYVVGVTWFARTEARASRPLALAAAAALMLAALLLALPLPTRAGTGATALLFPYVLVMLSFWVGLPVARAIRQPSPPRVQAAVRHAVRGLVPLDAALAVAVAGPAGLVLLVLLVPILLLGRWRWLYTT